MKDYEINGNTVALIEQNGMTVVYEDDRKFIVEESPNRIIKRSCLFYGSSFEGRLLGTKSMIGIRYKAPIVVSEGNNSVFFPTDSIKNSSCSWISLKYVNKCFSYQQSTVLKFKNNVEINLNLSKYVLDNQILRASRLLTVLNERKLEKKC